MLKKFRYQIAIFLSVIGPGLITANVDNDSGGILTYSQAGAKYGYLPLWTLIPITLLLIVTQEMCSRMGAVTGKGLADLIHQIVGLELALFVPADLACDEDHLAAGSDAVRVTARLGPTGRLQELEHFILLEQDATGRPRD